MAWGQVGRLLLQAPALLELVLLKPAAGLNVQHRGTMAVGCCCRGESEGGEGYGRLWALGGEYQPPERSLAVVGGGKAFAVFAGHASWSLNTCDCLWASLML